jgi:hypothetical protein
MGFFKRKDPGSPAQALPSDIVKLMQRWAEFELDIAPPPENIYTEFKGPLEPWAESDPAAFLDAMWRSCRGNTLATVGAAYMCFDLVPPGSRNGVAWTGLLEDSLSYFRDRSPDPGRVPGFFWERWIQRGGDSQRWVDWNVNGRAWPDANN